MERKYYPSTTRILLAYLAMPIGIIIVELTLWALNTINANISLAKSNLAFIGVVSISLFIWIGWNILRHGFRAFQTDKFAIKISQSSIDIPNLWSGKKRTIAFNKIDIQRTLNPKWLEKIFLNRHIYCLDGTQIVIGEYLFQPKQIEEIFTAIQDVAEHSAT